MNDIIYLSPQEINRRALINAVEHLHDAIKSLQSANAVMLGYETNHYSLFGGATGTIFSDATIGNTQSQMSTLTALAAKCESLVTIINSSPNQYEEIDSRFRRELVKETIRNIIRNNPFLAGGIIPVSITGWMQNLFGKGKQKTGAQTDIAYSLAIDADDVDQPSKKKELKHSTKVKVSDDAKGIAVGSAKDVWDNAVDNYREEHQKSGNTVGADYKTFSSTKHGSIGVLGTNFGYTTYTDYTSLSYSGTDGDMFYSMDGGFKKEIKHTEYEALDGSGISGSVTLNGVSAYADGEFDIAKGNAYVKAGADYTLASGTADLVGDGIVSVGFSGELGAGGHLNTGIHDGKITMDVGAALGLGGSINITIDYQEAWKATCDAFSFKGL